MRLRQEVVLLTWRTLTSTPWPLLDFQSSKPSLGCETQRTCTHFSPQLSIYRVNINNSSQSGKRDVFSDHASTCFALPSHWSQGAEVKGYQEWISGYHIFSFHSNFSPGRSQRKGLTLARVTSTGEVRKQKVDFRRNVCNVALQSSMRLFEIKLFCL